MNNQEQPPVVLAIDAGTGSARAIAFTTEGEIVARATREWTHHAVPGHPGGTSFDTKNGWTLIVEAVREVVIALHGRPIAAIGPSSMREGFVLYDVDGEEIWACPNTDGRARSQADDLARVGTADRVYDVGGDWVSITAPSRLLWLAQEEPEVLANTRHFGMLSDWVTYKLTGEFTTDPTCGSSSALFDLSMRTWSEELAGLVGLDVAVLPRVLECGTIAGQVTAEAALATGLPVGVPVAVGGADTQLALHGIGASKDSPTVVAGTFWQTTALIDSPLIDPQRRLRTLCHVDENRWMIEGIGFLSGLAMRWFRDAFCPDLIELARGGGVSAFDLMEAAAVDIPRGSNGTVAILANVMQADAWHHAAPAFVNFDINDPAKFNRGTFIRAIEEAAAYVSRAHLEILDELTDGAALRSGRITLTGGSSGGQLWPSIIAEVTNTSVALSNVPDATSYGAARLAATAVGIDMPPAASGDRSAIPRPEAAAAYDLHYRNWFGVYNAQVEATSASGLDPLFSPPGGLSYRTAAPTSPRITRRAVATQRKESSQ